MADIKLTIGTGDDPINGIAELTFDWSALGSTFANAGSKDQADFLDAVQTSFGDFASHAAELMQMVSIADAVRIDARVALQNWLTRMAEALDLPGKSEAEAQSPAKYETLGDIAKELAAMRADGMTVESVQYAMGQVYWDQLEAKANSIVAAVETARRGQADG